MKKMVFVLLLVALLLSLTLPVALAGCPAGEDPVNPGGRDFGSNPPPGLAAAFAAGHGNAGANWDWTP